jgi:hypothetical protein
MLSPPRGAGEVRMQRYYRCCFLNREGVICRVEGYMAAGDNKAVAKAERLFAGLEHHVGFEVWQGSRLLNAGRRRIVRDRLTGSPGKSD